MHPIPRRLVLKGSAISGIVSLAAGIDHASAEVVAEDALAVMSADPRLSVWVEVLKYAGLQDYAAGGENFTAFVPTNAAFEKYPWVIRDVLKPRSRAFPETTIQVEFIRSHVILDMHPLAEFSGRKDTVTSIAGYPIVIDGTKTGFFTVTWQSVEDRLATAVFTASPIVARNALIYPFDAVTFA